MSATRSASTSQRRAPRVASRAKASRFRPRVPEDFFSPEAWRLFSYELQRRASDWQVAGPPRCFYYGRDSEPVWGDDAHYRCSGTILHIAGQGVLRAGMGIDLERALRLLTVEWRADGKTIDGWDSAAWRAALAGIFWRVGQHYREFARRKGPGALEVLRQEFARLPVGGASVRVYALDKIA